MPVRAKFRCDSITKTEHGTSIKLYPVTSGSDENEKFYKYTPAGSVELSTINAEAAKQFVPGAEYYVDFTPMDSTPAA